MKSGNINSLNPLCHSRPVTGQLYIYLTCIRLSKLTLRNVLELTTGLRQAHLDSALHVVGSTPQFYAVSVPAFILTFSVIASNVFWFLRITRFLR